MKAIYWYINLRYHQSESASASESDSDSESGSRGESVEGSEASDFEWMRQGATTRRDLVDQLQIVAPMSATAWMRLATCLEETEEGLLKMLNVEDEAARVEEREAVRSCCKRVGRWRWGRNSLEAEEFSEEGFSKYWEMVTRK